MTYRRRFLAAGMAGFLGLLASSLPAEAVEYRLRVVNLHENAFYFFLRAGELWDGATGPGLERLESRLDEGKVSKGALLVDRSVRPVSETAARAYGGVPAAATVRPGGEGTQLWDEVRWEGKPGEQTVWLIKAFSQRPQRVTRLALRGSGPIRQYQPYTLPNGATKFPAVKVPLNFLWFQEERGTAWDGYAARVLDLGQGIGAIVGANTDSTHPDVVYLIVRHGTQPTTYKAVFAWRQASEDIESPSIEEVRR